jgi:hypothetical protein
MTCRLFRRRAGRSTFLSASVVLLSLVPMLSASSTRAAYDLIPWAANTHPSDVARTRVENITQGSHAYTIRQGGTMDGENCRTPLGVGMDGTNNAPMDKTWESNRSVRMENVGTADIVNPWLSNGRNNFRSREEIVAAATANCSTPREKALSIFWHKIPYHFHRQGYDSDDRDPVKIFNVYGYHVCGSDAVLMGFLWKTAGFSTVRPTHFMSHAEAQVYYDDRLNFMDADQKTYVLLRDNHTVANEQDIVHDHDLVKRTHTMGVCHRDDRTNDEGYASMFVYEGPPEGDRGSGAMKTTMNMTLRPNEAIVWRWGALNPVRYDGYSRLPISPYVLCNGLWEYRPDFTDDATWRNGTVAATNVVNTAGALTAAAGQTGTIIWKIASPYAIVGGRIAPAGSGYSFSFSRDNVAWQPVSGTDLNGHFPTIRDSFADKSFPPCYRYYLKCELSGGDKLTGLSIVNDLQMSAMLMPGMVVGDNTFLYTDRRPQCANYPRLGGTIGDQPAQCASVSDIPDQRRRERRNRHRISMDRTDRPRRRRDRGLPVRAFRTARHEISPVAQFSEIAVQDIRQREIAIYAALSGHVDARHGILLAREGKEQEWRVGSLEQYLEFYGKRVRLPRQRDDGHDKRRNRHAPVESQSGGKAAGEIPNLRQRRERLLRQRPRVHRVHRRQQGACQSVSGEFCLRDDQHFC